MSDEPDEIVELPVDGCPDLHSFRPRDIGTLIPDYLAECRRLGIFEVRIVHGKGRGHLHRGVEAVLARLDGIASWHPAHQADGGWGATIVNLQPALPDEKRG